MTALTYPRTPLQNGFSALSLRYSLTWISRGLTFGPFATLRQAFQDCWSRQHSKRLTRSGSTESALIDRSRQPSTSLPVRP